MFIRNCGDYYVEKGLGMGRADDFVSKDQWQWFGQAWWHWIWREEDRFKLYLELIIIGEQGEIEREKTRTIPWLKK